MKFDGTSVRALTDGKCYYWVGHGSSISDENGKLLFYTNGDTVFNRNHHIMPNGAGITTLGRGGIAPCVVVPNPASNGIYYVFVADRGGIWQPGALSYSTVDLTLNGGLGDITEKRHVLMTPLNQVLAAILHANGRDIWVVTHEFNTNRFFSFLVTASGVSETPVVSAIGALHQVGPIKQMQFSPDGDKIAVESTSTTFGVPDRNILEVFNFSVVTGRVSNQIFRVSDGTDFSRFRDLQGLEFSPNGRFLYASNGDSNGWARIFQFDLSAGNQVSILNSAVGLELVMNANEEGMQLGPDGKIYIARGGGGSTTKLSRINDPNKKGLACRYVENDFELGTGANCIALPIFVRNYVTPPPSFTTSPLCALDATTFYPSSLGYYDSLVWDFGDPASGAFNRSKTKQAEHKFSSDGIFNVSLTTYFEGVARRRVTNQLNIKRMARVELGKDTVICDGNSVALSVPNGFSQTWSTGETGSAITALKTGLYKVTMTNGQCTVKDSINVKVLDQPKIDFPDNIVACTDNQILDSKNSKFNVLWSTGETSNTIRVNQTGKYSVRITNEKCVAKDTVLVRIAPVADLTATVSKDTVGYYENITFSANASDIRQWQWNFGDGTQSEKQFSTHVYNNEGSYEANVTATNAFGCTHSNSLNVFVKRVLFIPNVLTPNGDGKNDSFTIQFNGDQEYGIAIYNRWGKQIHYSYGNPNQWNGGSEDAGTFFYLVTIGSERHKGWIQLIR